MSYLRRHCRVDGCDRTKGYGDLCNLHRWRAERWGDPLAEPRVNRSVVVVEETEMLASAGTAAEQIAATLGMSCAALSRALYRAGRHDLVRATGAEAAARRLARVTA